MKKIFGFSALALGICLTLLAFKPVEDNEAVKINWMTWEEAIEANKKSPKKIFVDVYTDWCGWCKRMDKTTFSDPGIVKKLNQNFYAVKMDAEMKREIKFNGHTFKYVPNGRRGYHTLAAALLDNRLSFPSFVALDENLKRISIIPGYHDTAGLNPILDFVKDEKYRTMTYKEYESTLK